MLNWFKPQDLNVQLTDGTIQFFDMVKELGEGQTNDSIRALFESVSGSLGTVNDGLEDFIDECDPAGDLMEQFTERIGHGDSKLSALGKALKGVAANIGIMLAVTLAIKGAMTIFDKLNVTAEEQQEIVDDLTEKVKGLKDEYNELSGNNNLTEAEKQKLDYLQRQLTVNEQILKQEQKKLALSKLYGDGDIFSAGELKATGVDSETDSKIQNDIAQLEKIRQQIKQNEASQSGNGIDYVYQKLARQEAYVEKEMPYLFLFLSLTPTSVYPVGRRIILN